MEILKLLQLHPCLEEDQKMPDYWVSVAKYAISWSLY